jgi:bifunctional UDP-N-acetylglucosamine pyrophosphorylase/glucosamine-1-phosphate N-acetyltransferase
VKIGQDTRIEPGCSIFGQSRVGEGVHIKANTVIESSTIENDVQIGPFAHLRPGCHIGAGSRIGNYVEVKNSKLGLGVKADHLSYIGDADVGDGASFGCGAIVVNYDGVDKHRTFVGARAFIGCNVNLIAPIRIESDSFVAAGSTITKNIPRDALAVGREKQRTIKGWVSKNRRKKE